MLLDQELVEAFIKFINQEYLHQLEIDNHGDKLTMKVNPQNER